MKFTSKITQLTLTGAVSGVFASSLLFSAIATPQIPPSLTPLAQALSPVDVNLRAKQIIVRIDGASVGSGSILEKNGDTYTVLTNWHVMKNEGGYTVQTIDGRKHEVIPASIQQLPGLDLAVFKFQTSQYYQTAELGDSSSVSEGQIIYFAGYPGELRREDNRYYRFFTANMVGILPKATENGYSLIYSGEAFPGMSGGPVFNRDGLLIGVHGEANVHALSGGTSNYAIPIATYQQAIAKLNSAPEPTASTPPASAVGESEPVPEIIVEQPEAKPEPQPEPEISTVKTPEPQVQKSPKSKPLDSENISSVPTFSPEPEAEVSKPEPDSKSEAEPETESVEIAKTSTPQAEVAKSEPEPEPEPEPVELEEISVPTVTRKIALVSPKTGIDYTKLRNLLKAEQWSEADIHTYRLVEQIVKSAKNNKKTTFIELKTIAEYSCPDVRTIDYLWKKYSDDQFGFSPQQKVWQNVNQDGDFSTQTWRRFATQVGWKQGEVSSGSGYLLYDQLDFEPNVAPEGHLPWWFALPDEEQKVIKHLFIRCNLNPTLAELEAEAKKNAANTIKKPDNNGSRGQGDRDRPNAKKPSESANN
ncbi:MAG: GUN4 domain-containing protein [Cyanobacteria bacterium J06600_6]